MMATAGASGGCRAPLPRQAGVPPWHALCPEQLRLPCLSDYQSGSASFISAELTSHTVKHPLSEMRVGGGVREF